MLLSCGFPLQIFFPLQSATEHSLVREDAFAAGRVGPWVSQPLFWAVPSPIRQGAPCTGYVNSSEHLPGLHLADKSAQTCPGSGFISCNHRPGPQSPQRCHFLTHPSTKPQPASSPGPSTVTQPHPPSIPRPPLQDCVAGAEMEKALMLPCSPPCTSAAPDVFAGEGGGTFCLRTWFPPPEHAGSAGLGGKPSFSPVPPCTAYFP